VACCANLAENLLSKAKVATQEIRRESEKRATAVVPVVECSMQSEACKLEAFGHEARAFPLGVEKS
jgi:hypothetical protein